MIRPYFDNIKQTIIEELIKTEQSVWIASAFFADRSIFKLLCTLAQRGIEVNLLIADEKINLVQTELNYGELVSAGGSFYLANRTPLNSLMHHKFCVIDRIKTITGSYNYTLKAQSNRENIVIVESKDVAEAYIKEFNYVVEHFSVHMKEWKNEFLPSGFVDIDRITSGFHSGELICLSGLTGMGCTSLALSIGYNLSTVFNQSVGFITTALSSGNIGLRYLSIHSDLALSTLQKGDLKDYEWQTLHLKVPYVEGSLFQTFFAETYKEMEMKCKAYSYENVDLIIIDNINQFLRAADNDSELIAPVLEGLKSLSRQIRIPILFTYTLPAGIRGKYRNSNKRPSIADLGQIYNYVDTVFFLHRDEYFEILEDENGESTIGMAEVIVPKSYIGSSGYSCLKFDAKSLKFENLPDMTVHGEY